MNLFLYTVNDGKYKYVLFFITQSVVSKQKENFEYTKHSAK